MPLAQSPPDELDPNHDRLGRYVLSRPLARGGMGIVYEAYDSATGAPVAVKMLFRNDPEAREGFRQEVELLKRVRHRAVVSLVDDGIGTSEKLWYAMELLRGQTIRDYNSKLWSRAADDATTLSLAVSGKELRRSALPMFFSPTGESPLAGQLDEVLRLYARVFESLQNVHDMGVVHGDLSPANVFVRTDGSPVLLDFGSASWVFSDASEDEETRRRIAGTSNYLAPEQIRRERIQPRTDLYSLGCMMYETLTGMPPFIASDTAGLLRAHIEARVVPPSDFWPFIPVAIEQLLLSLLEKQPDDRPESARAVADRMAFSLASERRRMLGSRRRLCRDSESPRAVSPESYLAKATAVQCLDWNARSHS